METGSKAIHINVFHELLDIVMASRQSVAVSMYVHCMVLRTTYVERERHCSTYDAIQMTVLCPFFIERFSVLLTGEGARRVFIKSTPVSYVSGMSESRAYVALKSNFAARLFSLTTGEFQSISLCLDSVVK
jgi:hypothetical protein